MAYTINKTNGNVLATVDDGTVNSTACDLVLIGRNVSTYGERQNENVVKLLENFAKDSAPAHPLEGQLWFDTAESQLKVQFDGSWQGIASYTKDTAEPSVASAGDLWYNATTKQVKLWDGVAYKLIGPIAIGGGGDTVITAETFRDVGDVDHEVLSFYVDGTRLAVLSPSAQFTTGNLVPEYTYTGFTTVKPGFNLNTTVSGAVFNVTANNAQALNSLTSSQFMRADADTATTGNIAVTKHVTANSVTANLIGDGGWISNIRASNIVGYVSSANTANVAIALQTPRNIALTGNVLGNVNFDGSADVSISTTFAEDRLKLSGGTMTGQLNANVGFIASTNSANNLLCATTTKVGVLTNDPKVALDVNGAIRSVLQVNGSTGGSIAIDGSYTNHQINLATSATISLTNFSQPGQVIRIILVGTENQVNWGSDVYWPNNASPNLANGSKKIAIVTLMRPATITPNITYRPDANFVTATYVSY